MKKILSILVCVCVLLSAMVFTASAADGVSISFADKSARTSYSTSQQIWEQNGIKVTNDKGASTSNVGDYANPGRFYKSSTVTIEYPGMTSIVIDSVTYDDNDYAAPWANSFDASLGTATVNDGDVTITLNNAVDSLAFATMSGQGRAYSITVYTDGSTPPPAVDEEEDKDDTTTSTATVVDSPVAGTAYKYALAQENLGKVLYVTGEMDAEKTYYMATTENVSEAADVYLEETDGGYFIYALVGGVKKYMNIIEAEGSDGKSHINAVYGETGVSVFTQNTEKNVFVTKLGDADYAFGTYNTFNTVSPSNFTKYPDNFWCQFYTVSTGEDVTPPAGDEEDTPVELPTPDATNTLTIKEALELGKAQEDNVYTDKYYVTGVITAVSSTTWGNVYITDEDGNSLYVYGMYSADGETRYDELESKPDEGDTVTLYGGIGQYGGTPQMKNVWLIGFTAGELEAEDTDPEADSVLTIEEAIALGESKLHDVYTANKYYVTGTILEVYNENYGNLYLVDEAGNQLTIYGSWNEDGTLSYSQMENKPVAGDIVTLYGIIGQYNGTAQMKNGWFKDAPVVEGGDDTTNNDTTGGNTDNSTTSPDTGDNAGALVAFAMMAAAALVYTSKKR